MIPKRLIKKTIIDLSKEGMWNIEFVSGKKRYKVKYNKEKDEVFTDEFGVFDFEKIENELPEMGTLSNREKEVFQMLLTDKKRKEIADELCITENTVKKHTSNIFVKLDVSSRAELLNKIKSI